MPCPYLYVILQIRWTPCGKRKLNKTYKTDKGRITEYLKIITLLAASRWTTLLYLPCIFSAIQNNISSSEVVQWSNHRVMEWLRSVDLAEYAPNLRGSGVHGGLIVRKKNLI